MQAGNRKNLRSAYFASWARDLGSRVLIMRRDMRLDQRAFMEAAGLGDRSVMAVSKLERGVLRRVEMDFLAGLATLARERGYSLVWLLTGEGRMRGGDRGALEALDDRELMIEIGRRRIGAAVHDYIEELQGVIRDRAIDVIESKKRQGGELKLSGPEGLPVDWDRHWVPVINSVAAGGDLIDTLEAEAGPPGWADEYVACEQPPARAIAVRVAGDSMMPRFASGDVLVLDPAVGARAGEPAAVVYRTDSGDFDRRAVVKIWRPGRKNVRLEAVNPDYRPITIPLSRVIHAYAIWRHLRR